MEKICFSYPHSTRKKGMMYADMHVHSRHSDGRGCVKDILDITRRKNIAVAITDHNEISGAEEAYRIKKKSDIVIPGIEVKSSEMVDILFYFDTLDKLKIFYEKEIKDHKEKFLHSTKTTLCLERLYELSKEYDCIASVAHPYGYMLRLGKGDIFDRYKDILLKFENIEAMNGGNSRKQNLGAIGLIKTHGKGMTAGTDSHTLITIGNILAYSSAGDIKSFLDDIKNKKNKVIGIETSMGKIGEYINYLKNIIRGILKR